MKLKFEYQIALGYLIISGLWIFFSDYIIYGFATDKQMLTHLQTFKGWFFVLATGFLLFLFVRKHLKKQRQTENELIVKNKSLNSYKNALQEKADDYLSLLEEYKAQNEDLIYSKSDSDKGKEQFQFLLDYAPDPIFIYSDNSFKYLNQKAVQLFGFPNSDVPLGKSIFNVFSSGSKGQIEKDFEQVKTAYSSRLHREFKVVNEEGDDIDVEASAVPIVYEKKPATLVFLRDITKSKNYLKEIEEKNLFIQTILDNLPIGLALNRFNEGDATYMNKKFVEIYGWPKEELINIESFFEKVYPDQSYRNEMIDRISKDIATGDPNLMHWENITITRKSGEKRMVNAVNIPLPEQNTMISTVIDITDLKTVERNLLSAKEKAEESDRLKTAFLNNISHEFRTPLNGILGFVEMVIRPGISDEKKKKYVSIIRESSNKLVDIVKDTVEVSHIQTGHSKVVKRNLILSDVVNEVCALYKPIAEKKGIKLNEDIDIQEKDNKIICDKHKLFRILQHLIDNAVKFTDNGSVDIHVIRNNSSLQMKVSDSGVGISLDMQDAIFDAFRQTESGYSRSFGGSGIGLFLVKSYVALLNGKIHLESEPNMGATFTVELPMYQS